MKKTPIFHILSVTMVLGLVLAACQPQVVEVEKEVVVEKVVEKAVEIEVEAAPEIAYVEVETEKSLDDAIGFVDIAPGEAVHIAYMLATSGAVEFLGADSLGGIEIAIEEYGQIHGHDVLLTGEDSLCSAEGGQTAATKVASDPTILGVLGTNCSSAGTAASVVLSEAGMLMISPTNTSPALTDPNETWNPGYYRTAHNDKFQGRVAAEFAYNELGLTTAAALHDGDPYTEGLASVFAEVFAELGGTVTSFEAINKGDTDMRPVLTTIAADSPEALYFPIFEPEGNFVGAQSEEVPGLENTVLMGADGLLVKSFGPNTGPAAEGMYLSGPYVSEDVSAYANFLEKYEANTGGPPPAGFAAHAYDGANILLSAIEKVAIVDDDGTLHVGRQALRDAVGSTYRYGGLTGILSCDEYGDCATGEALAIFQLSADNVASEDNWPPEVVYTPTGGSAGEIGSAHSNILTLAHSEYAWSYDPLFCNWSDIGRICAVAYDSLVKFDPMAKQVVAHLAHTWTVSDDALTYTFELNEGVKFHDGTEVNAADVKYSIERMKALDDGAASLLAPVDTVEVLDDYTVSINLSGVNAAFLMSLPMIMVVNQDLAEANTVDGDWAQGYLYENDLGSGPYTVVSTVPEQEAVLTKFEDYWLGWEGDHIDGIIFQWIKESATQRLALEAGTLDIMMEPVMSELAGLGDAGYQILEGSSAVIFSVDFRTTHAPLDNILVRKALAHAVDADYHIDVALAGFGRVANTVLASEIPYHNADVPVIPFDMDKAQELLAEAGYPDGGFTLKVAYESAQDEKTRAFEMVQQNWGALGITVEPIGVDWMIQTTLQGDPDSEPDVYLGYIWPAAAEPDTAMREYWHSEYLSYGNNGPYWSDPQVDALFEKGITALSDYEREGYYREIQALIAEAVPQKLVSEGPYLIVAQPWVKGYVYNVAHHQAVDVYNMQLVGKP